MEGSDELRRDEAKRLYRDGLSERAVADAMGVSRSRVVKLLDEGRVRRRAVGRHKQRRNRKRS